MQESYISLDPAKADSMTSQQRARLWSQRVQEACGGPLGHALGCQMSLTLMVCSYTSMRHKGFRITPLAPSKLPALGGLLLVGICGYGFGTSIAGASMGNSKHYNYLL